MTQKPTTLWVVTPDQCQVIFFENYEYATEFKVYDFYQQCGEGDALIPFAGRAFEYELQLVPGARPTLEMSDKWEIDGAVKWDGCINWQTNPHCMAHGCGPNYASEIADIFAIVYHVAKRYHDLLGDDAPPMPEGAVEI